MGPIIQLHRPYVRNSSERVHTILLVEFLDLFAEASTSDDLVVKLIPMIDQRL
jgi:hypothetical protein